MQWHFYITYTDTSVTMSWFLTNDISILLILILISIGIDFCLVTSLYYVRFYLFNHVFIFTYWYFYITYTYTYFNMLWSLDIGIFKLLTLILVSSCIDFYTMTFFFYLQLYLSHHIICFKHRRFYVTHT